MSYFLRSRLCQKLCGAVRPQTVYNDCFNEEITLNILSYVITHDYGFAPNPYGDFLSLATCKPVLRRNAKVGDVILATGSVKTVGNGKIVYAAIVSEIVSMEDYGSNSRYEQKMPPLNKSGDSIYYWKGGTVIQRENQYHGKADIVHDVSGRNVLLCEEFWYYGKDAIEVPANLIDVVKKGPGYKRIKSPELIDGFTQWLRGKPKGIKGNPYHNTNRGGCNVGCGTSSTNEDKSCAISPSCID